MMEALGVSKGARESMRETLGNPGWSGSGTGELKPVKTHTALRDGRGSGRERGPAWYGSHRRGRELYHTHTFGVSFTTHTLLA